MRFGSLFTGIGGLDLGLERAGMRCAWQVEIDEYARRVLKKHWPDVPKFDDVRRVHGRNGCPEPWRQMWCRECLDPNVDLLCGGFPCQDISVAGKGKGLAGERSGLWREFARIIEEIRPRFVLVENVPALRTRGLRVVLSDLHASGYDAEWDCLPAAAFGAPHRRDRIFVVAYAKRQSVRFEQGRSSRENGTGAIIFGRDGQPSQADPQRFTRDAWGAGNSDESQRGRNTDRGSVGSDVAYADREGELQQGRSLSKIGGRASNGGSTSNPWTTEPDVGRVAHGVPSRVDRLRGLGNAVVPQVAEYVGRLIMESTR